MTSRESSHAPETVVVEAGRPQRSNGSSVNPPIELSSTFVGSGETDHGDYVYGRFSTPAWTPFEEALAELEHAALPGLVFGSGLAAIAAALSLVPRGGTLIMPRHSYQGSLEAAGEVAQRSGFRLATVDIVDTAVVVDALDDVEAASAVLWIESPTNPMLEVADVPALISAARDRGILTVFDNTFATPLLQTPLDLGADVVVHSVTKYLAGHSDVVLGAALTNSEELHKRLHDERSLRGAIAGPFEVWLALRGLRTLSVRMERAQANAALIADRLSSHPNVTETRYPGLPEDPGHERAAAQMSGFGAMVAFCVETGQQATAVAEAVRVWTPATSLGGVESLIERRRRNASEAESVPDGFLRLSVGIEHADDLWNDLDAAIRAAHSA
ncbi:MULTISPECIES: PLP-dependent aspartate aminotransferase family protein [Brevibacterium]|uniref:homocysteine desulfhydrase n=2 Tax=Brevibacterium antiquum TaxID=234835 RepID=A0A2H1K1E3_9MICO|nr:MULTISPECIES: PLP-dependent aspartate aminotransferase family protein [Brevibacterium]SMX83512.1 cystathionine gamma-synthase [Brevibacterium antiquum]SMX93533.1 cystathionine gamma-synthase [Brevibacterium antiquum CNRZ 918]HCG55602.1 PLP-dependent transferase [Brevibacterium sp.]